MHANVRTSLSRRNIRAAATFLSSAVLIASVLGGSSTAVAEGPDVKAVPDSQLIAPSDSDKDKTLDAPDTASAVAGAAAEDKPVEDLSQRTGTSITVVNPDGTRTLTQHQSPVRVKRAGKWVDIDSTLMKQEDGTFQPKVSATKIVIGAGGTKDAGEVTFEDGHSVTVTWA
jgi:hypothetical protein